MANKKASADTVRTGIEEITTQGDLLYRGATDLKHLSKGSSGQQLSMGNSNEPEWITVADELPAAGTSGNLLTSTGSAWASTAPSGGLSSFAAQSQQTTIGNTSNTKMAYPTELWDTDGVYNNTLYRFTPTVGKWIILADILLGGFPTNSYASVRVLMNGSEKAEFVQSSSHTANLTINVSFPVNSTNGTDYFEIWCYHNSGSNKVAQQKSFFSAWKVE